MTGQIVSHSPSKKIAAYFGASHHELQSIIAKINHLQQLSQKISPYLDPDLTHFYKIANLIGNKLIIVAANGSIATQLRFQVTDLLKKFSLDPELKHIHQIECKVRPASSFSSPMRMQRTKMPLLSPETAELIRNMAENIEDKVLREIMERIASRVG